LPSVCCLHEVLNDWSGILTKNIAGSSGIELPILFASIESIDTFVSIDDFDIFSIVSPITTSQWFYVRNEAEKLPGQTMKKDLIVYQEIQQSDNNLNSYVLCMSYVACSLAKLNK
jgi:hypothetical protein